MRRWLWIAVVSALVGAGLWFTAAPSPPAPVSESPATVVIRGHIFAVDVANDQPARERGLMGRAALGPDEGLLFVFEVPGYHAFWMKGMLIPIDIVWINGERVVGVTENVFPEGDVADETRARRLPPEPVDLVLEIAAGRAAAVGIAAGDAVMVRWK